MNVAQNEKRKKQLGFSFYKNIGNFEAFLRNLNLSAEHLFWRCEYLFIFILFQQTFIWKINYDLTLKQFKKVVLYIKFAIA